MIGKWFASTGRRSEVFLATKFGAFEPLPDGASPTARANASLNQNSKPSYIKRALERSLSQLQTSYIDLYYQHRVDPDVPIEVVIEALREPVREGKIKWIGLSECSAEHVRRAKKDPVVGSRIVACQVEFSPFVLFVEKGGLAKTCEEEGVGIVCYSPLAKGMLTGK